MSPVVDFWTVLNVDDGSVAMILASRGCCSTPANASRIPYAFGGTPSVNSHKHKFLPSTRATRGSLDVS